MVSSMGSRPHRAVRPVSGGAASSRPLSRSGVLTLVVLMLGLAVAIGATPVAAAPATGGLPGRVSAPRCSTDPPAGSVDGSVPWPQARYDLATLGQISQGAGITVAVVDSGVSPTTPQLAGAVQGGGDMLDATGDGRLDCVGHGTAVASIIAARPVAGSGLRGLAPAAGILAIRASERVSTENGPTGAGDVQELVDGIRAAVRHNPRPQVINLSISTTTDNAALRAAVQAALDADIVVVAAVGNLHSSAGGSDPQPYPASYDGVVGVGAIGPTGQRVGSSQVGSYVDIVAPGDAVVGATPAGGHLPYQGTSFATPFVAATAALIRARWPEIGRTEVVRRLLATADPSAGARPSMDYGYGVLNPMRALTEVIAPAPAGPATSPTPVIQPGLAAGGDSPSPTVLAVTAALILILASTAIAGVAAAMPAGRRRGWRPGRIEPTPTLFDRPAADPSRR